VYVLNNVFACQFKSSLGQVAAQRARTTKIVGLEVLMAVTVKRVFLYDVAPCNLVDVYRRSILTDRLRGLIFDLENGDSMFLRNVGELPPNCTRFHPTR
jgi:hypothetical protein